MLVSGSTVVTDFNFINDTLATHLDNRPPQKILIDVGGAEASVPYSVNIFIAF